MRDRHEAPGRSDRRRTTRPFDLVFAPDDESAPTEITAFPERGADHTTAWITMDADHVVDLAEHA